MKLISLLFLLSFQAQAQLAAPPQAIAFQPKPILPKEVPCADLKTHIEMWGQFRADADLAVASFGEQFSNVVESWVKQLKPLEGKSTAITVGFFAPVEQGSNALQENIPLIYENSDYFDSHLKTVILPTLEKCLQEKASNGISGNN